MITDVRLLGGGRFECAKCGIEVAESHFTRDGWCEPGQSEPCTPSTVAAGPFANHEFPGETLATAVKDMLDYMESRGYRAPTYHVLCVRQALERANG